jgi:hypothetical protein
VNAHRRRFSGSELHFEPQLGELAREILEVEPASAWMKTAERSILSSICTGGVSGAGRRRWSQRTRLTDVPVEKR